MRAAAAAAPLAPPDPVVELTAAEAPALVDRDRRPRRWRPRSRPRWCPSSTPRSTRFLQALGSDGRQAARSSRPRPRASAPWATPTSARPPRRPTGCSSKPVRALKEGGIAQGSRRSARRCSSCAAPSRTSTRARPPARRVGCDMLPFGDKIDDYFRKYQSLPEPAQRHPAQPAQRPGRADQGQRRAQPGEDQPVGGRWAGSTSTSTSPSGSTRSWRPRSPSSS